MQETKTRDVTITVNNNPVEVPRLTTGTDIKQFAGIDQSWQLFRIQGDHEVAVGDAEQVHATPNEKFVATPALEPA